MYKILVAEDEFINRRLLLKLLEPYGECSVAVDGLTALEEFKTALDKEEPFQLIFLDIVMPNIGGIDVLKRIRAIENKRNIPEDQRVIVIMTTAVSDRQSVIQAAFNQCNAYLVKPVKQEALAKKLKELGIDLSKEQKKEPEERKEETQQSETDSTKAADITPEKDSPEQEEELPENEESGINPENLLDEEY